jgi:hypothetical protein
MPSVQEVNKVRIFVNKKIEYRYWRRNALANPKFQLSPTGKFLIRNPYPIPSQPEYFKLEPIPMAEGHNPYADYPDDLE